MTPIEEVLSSDETGFEDNLANQWLIEEALLSLPKQHAKVVLLSFQGFTQAQIGAEMGISRTTVWGIKKKALGKTERRQEENEAIRKGSNTPGGIYSCVKGIIMKEHTKLVIKEWAESIIIALLLALFIRTFFITPSVKL